VHIGLQMCKRKFISIKYTRPYSYTKFRTFFCATRCYCAYLEICQHGMLAGPINYMLRSIEVTGFQHFCEKVFLLLTHFNCYWIYTVSSKEHPQYFQL